MELNEVTHKLYSWWAKSFAHLVHQERGAELATSFQEQAKLLGKVPQTAKVDAEALRFLHQCLQMELDKAIAAAIQPVTADYLNRLRRELYQASVSKAAEIMSQAAQFLQAHADF